MGGSTLRWLDNDGAMVWTVIIFTMEPRVGLDEERRLFELSETPTR